MTGAALAGALPTTDWVSPDAGLVALIGADVGAVVGAANGGGALTVGVAARRSAP